MTGHAQLLQTRERLLVGRRFLMLRPFITACGALLNAVCLSFVAAPTLQKALVGGSMGTAVGAFFVERALLRRRPLSERWLFCSLLLTLLTLAFASFLSGALHSPMTPLLFAPTVVGFAAFALRPQSAALFAVTCCVWVGAAWTGPLPGFAPPPPPWGTGMLLISCATCLSLLAVGVISLVEAHARIARELDRMRTDMLREAELRANSVERLGAQVAHDVKNPLTAVRGLVQLVQRKASERDQERLLVAIGEIDHALDVLQDYLSWARPLRDLELRELDLSALLADVAGVLEARALERKVQVRLAGSAPLCLADRQKLRDALLNLSLNALHAMPEGGTLTFTLQARTGGMEIVVADTGRGMSAQELARIGQPFVTTSEGGTGLGVALSRSVAEQHGGTLQFESAPGQGTRAVLRLPLRREVT